MLLVLLLLWRRALQREAAAAWWRQRHGCCCCCCCQNRHRGIVHGLVKQRCQLRIHFGCSRLVLLELLLLHACRGQLLLHSRRGAAGVVNVQVVPGQPRRALAVPAAYVCACVCVCGGACRTACMHSIVSQAQALLDSYHDGACVVVGGA